jgi:hypothetical protein
MSSLGTVLRAMVDKSDSINKNEKNIDTYGEELLINDITMHENTENNAEYVREKELKSLKNKAESLMISRNLLGEVYVYIFVYLCVYICTCMNTCMYIYTCTCIHIYVCIHTLIYIYVDIYTYIYTYIHI